MRNDSGKTVANEMMKRHLYENIAILTISLGLFVAALFADVHGLVDGLFAHDVPVVDVKYRSLGGSTRMAASGSVLQPADVNLNAMLSFGLAASCGLTIFAFLQYGRLRRALARQREAERQTRQLAMHDQLTGLANRRNFEEFGQRVSFERPSSELRAVFLIDLDHFKTVNDVHGHAAGDKVLIDYASRIATHFPGGIVSRFGGDEFAVITPPLKEPGEAHHYARFCIAGVAEPFEFNGVKLHLGASVGVAMIGDADTTLAEALRHADIALYKAKRAGRMQIAFFEETLEHVIRERNWIETELRAALADGSIVPYFQPVVDLNSRDIIGYEALARWQHAERGLIKPDEFIPVAEECGLVSQLGEMVLIKACAVARHWPPHILLSVNLSPVQLRDKALGRKLLDIIAAVDFPASRLEVEITENALISDLETARSTIDALRAAGVSVALDDFGTGHSTLNHLTICRFDRLKIDRSFVSSMTGNHDSRRIVDAILNLSRSFGIRCTAEGIESAGELQILSDWGCREGQGYLFGRPEQTTSFDRPVATPGQLLIA
uniref:putative bifunctional diguanylate cyclase/phosphodiesterase n=1 Tax=uncultured Rhizobium sp. TaxID=155567 RepID=UPI002605702B|nr:EAL domain-containing protein [uncultured Rhizobium sp.]